MRLAGLLFALPAILLLVPALVLFIQVLAALPARRKRALSRKHRPCLAVLIPAHNEATGIADTLADLHPQLLPGDRLLVVADNCTDGTAAIAAAAGAEVVERHNREQRGKGYALDFGIRHLVAEPPEVVIVVDADCRVAPGAIDRLARLCAATARPVQALYLMTSPPNAGLATRIAEFAWRMKNLVRPLGYLRLGLPCQLMGTGMAFPWPAIAAADLASGHLVEDLKLGLDLARRDLAPLFCPEARVSSTFPASREGQASQRTRWEHGHLGMLLALAPRLVLTALARRKLSLLALALDLGVPPLALLVLLTLAVVAGSVLLSASGGSSLPLAISGLALAFLAGAVLLAWWRFGRPVLSLANLAYAPVYALWKIPLYLRFLSRRQLEWVRSRRDPRNPAPGSDAGGT